MKKFLFLGLLPISLIFSACPQNSGSAKVTSTEWAKAINALINRDVDNLTDESKSLAKDGSENSKLPLSGKTSGYTLDISCKMKSGDSFETFKGKQWIAKTWFVQEIDNEILADYTKGDNSVWFADKQGKNNWQVYSNNTQLKERYSTYEEFVKSLRVLEAQYDNAKLTSKGYKIEGYANDDVNDGIYKEKKNKEGEAWGTFYLKFNSEKQISSFSIATEDASGDFGVKYSDDLKYDFGEVIPNFQ